ncbi:MAG: membrane protein insertase YidC [Candidatus Omnitrophica bacterium]|nr:membrane protein insertase YidC [Candidatus Omnitrophota bacterium]
MEKRLIAAIALSVLILLSWSLFTSKFYPIDNNRVIPQKTETLIPAPVVKPAPPPVEEALKPQGLFTVEQNNYSLVFDEAGASIQEIIFPAYQFFKFTLNQGLLLKNFPAGFKKDSASEGIVSFVYRDQEKEITKKFILSNSNYIIMLEMEIKNVSSQPLHINLDLLAAGIHFNADQNEARFQDATFALKDKVLHLNLRKDISAPGLKFLGWRDRYFCGIIEPQHTEYSAFISTRTKTISEISLVSSDLAIPARQSVKQKFYIYLGPQELSLIKKLNPSWTAVVYYGTFDFIARLQVGLLTILYGLVRNWGWAIVLFSLAIYIILYPLTLKQMRSMKEMQLLQPHIEELRKSYKDNPQKLNKAIMDLYREHKVNPLGGCLPMVLQIPIFFALYQVLLRSVSLRGANFLWIKDLSKPDNLFTLPVSLPIIGNEINILPILMTIGMFIQQKTSTVATGSNAEQQKLMLIIFPLMFGLIFYRMPSGLVLYWFINSTLMLSYQLRMNRKR